MEKYHGKFKVKTFRFHEKRSDESQLNYSQKTFPVFQKEIVNINF